MLYWLHESQVGFLPTHAYCTTQLVVDALWCIGLMQLACIGIVELCEVKFK